MRQGPVKGVAALGVAGKGVLGAEGVGQQIIARLRPHLDEAVPAGKIEFRYQVARGVEIPDGLADAGAGFDLRQ